MANQYAPDSRQMLIRLPEDMKRDLYKAVEKLNADNPGAMYSANSVVRALIEKFIISVEQHEIPPILSQGLVTENFKITSDAKTAELNNDVTHRQAAFEELVNVMRENSRRYSEYGLRDDLLQDSWKQMRVHAVVPENLAAGKELDVYYNNAKRNFYGCDYIALYNKRAIQAVGKIIDIVDAVLKNDDELESSPDMTMINDMLALSSDDITDDIKERICRAIERDEKLKENIVHEPHRFYFVDKFHETEFIKATPRGLWGTRIFNLTEYLSADDIQQGASRIAELLRGREWQ